MYEDEIRNILNSRTKVDECDVTKSGSARVYLLTLAILALLFTVYFLIDFQS